MELVSPLLNPHHDIQKAWGKVREAKEVFKKSPNQDTALALQSATKFYESVKRENIVPVKGGK